VKTFFIDLHNLLFSNQFVTAFIVYKSYWDKKLDDFFVGLVNKNKLLKLCKEKKKTKLDKKFKANINIDVEVPPIIKSNKVSLDDINKYARKVAKCLFVFQTILEHENVDLNIFYNNLKSLKINQSNFIQKILNKINKRSGWYSPDDNEINYVDRLEAKDTIFHELLHAASSIEDKEESISFSGFEQINCERWQKIGRALNEGYTELLNQRYFSPVRDVYTMEVTIAKMIERIVGREKMTEIAGEKLDIDVEDEDKPNGGGSSNTTPNPDNVGTAGNTGAGGTIGGNTGGGTGNAGTGGNARLCLLCAAVRRGLAAAA